MEVLLQLLGRFRSTVPHFLVTNYLIRTLVAPRTATTHNAIQSIHLADQVNSCMPGLQRS